MEDGNSSIETLTLKNATYNNILAVKQNSSIQTLNIVNTFYLPVSFDQLAEVLKCHSTLTSVSIEFSVQQIKLADMQLLCDGMSESKSIKRFNYYWGDWTEYEFLSVEAITLLFNKFIPRKQTDYLKIHGDTGTSLDCSSIIDALKSPERSLNGLEFPLFHFKTDQTEALALALEANKSLEHIDLGITSFSIEAWQVMQRWLVSPMCQLKSFLLRNRYTQITAFDVSDVIRCNSSLTTLHYPSMLSIIDMHKIVSVLKVNDTLTDLDLNYSKTFWFHRLLAEKFEADPNFNFALRKVNFLGKELIDVEVVVDIMLKRNIEYQSLMHINTIILIHNIARDKSSFEQLPREMWLLIFEKLRYPGMTNFKSKAESIFNSYLTRK